MKEEEKSSKILVAVYGTLRKESGNHRILSSSPTAQFVGMHVTEPKYTMYSLGGFPGVKENGETAIITEIYSVEDEFTKRRLDALEGYTPGNEDNNFYNKVKINTEFGEAEMYIYNYTVNEDRIISSGDWYNR